MSWIAEEAKKIQETNKSNFVDLNKETTTVTIKIPEEKPEKRLVSIGDNIRTYYDFQTVLPPGQTLSVTPYLYREIVTEMSKKIEGPVSKVYEEAEISIRRFTNDNGKTRWVVMCLSVI